MNHYINIYINIDNIYIYIIMSTIIRYDTLASEIIHEPEIIVMNKNTINEKDPINKKVLYLDDDLLVVVEKKNSDEKPKTC